LIRKESYQAGRKALQRLRARRDHREAFFQFLYRRRQGRWHPAARVETAEREGKFESKGWRARKDDGKFWAYVIIDPNVTTKLIGFAKVTRDLTERKEAEDSLKKTQEQFRLLVQGVTD
jgi:PAS domain-containing protein